MKFNTMSRTGLAAAASLAIALGVTACSRDYTAAYVYSVSSSSGTVSAYAVDYQSGVLTQLSGSPFATQFTNPTTVVSTPSGKFIYVVSGNQNAQVEPFAVGTDGKLYGQPVVNITGTYPTAATIDSTGSFLYVTYRYQTPYSPASPGPGGITVFKIGSDGNLSSALNVNVGNSPVGISVSAPICTAAPLNTTNAVSCTTSGQKQNVFVYVVDQETSPNANVLGFYQSNSTTGALALLPGQIGGTQVNTCTTTAPTVCKGVLAGVTPSAIVTDPTGRYVYVTDKTSNEIFGYAIGSSAVNNTAGILTALVSSPYSTGLYPVAIIVDPRGKYVYTANYNGNSVSSYSLNSADGSLGGTAAVGNFGVQTGPTCLTVDPALGKYLYTSNYLDNSISGGQLSANTGQLTQVATSFFPSGALPSCLTSVPNGPRSSSYVSPSPN
jgi:6-phosphogluconolactonase (cycloisomerase 2 family)